MAQATIQGTLGAATIIGEDANTAFSGKFDMWSASLDSGIVETTGFGDLGYRKREPTIARMTGSASGMVITDYPPIPALALGASFAPASVKGEIVLTATTGCTYTFDAVISDVQMNRPEDGKATFTCNFTSTGRITQAWS